MDRRTAMSQVFAVNAFDLDVPKVRSTGLGSMPRRNRAAVQHFPACQSEAFSHMPQRHERIHVPCVAARSPRMCGAGSAHVPFCMRGLLLDRVGVCTR